MSDNSRNQDINNLVKKFQADGLLSEKEIALCFELKRISRMKKGDNFNAFLFNRVEANDFFESLQKMLKSNNAFNFTFAYKSWGDTEVADGHWTSGCVSFKPEDNELKMFLCDPLGMGSSQTLKSFLTYCGFNFEELAKNHSFEVFLAMDTLQRSLKGCSYFAIDSCFMLSQDKNRDSLFDYMKSKGEKEEDGNVTVYSSEVPPFLRRQQQSLSTLESALSDDAFSATVVNKKGHTFAESVKSHRIELTNPVPRMINARMQNKRERLRDKVSTCLNSDSHAETSVKEQIEKAQENHRLPGFQKYSEKVVSNRINSPRSE
jgi:hypothetical protein